MPVTPREKWDTKEQYLEYLRHLTAYLMLAEPLVGNSTVLDIGCGAGYGDDYLSKSAFRIVAMDISREGVSHYWDEYKKNNLDFVLGNGTSLPFKAGSFSVVISFQMIEHIETKFVLGYLAEIRRVLKKGGIFVCSTPNKKLRLLPFQKPWNPEHKKEYDRRELKNLLSKAFESVKVYGLCGSSEVQAIEIKRVKQVFFKAYIARPFYQVLNHLLLLLILTKLKSIRQHVIRSQISYKPMPQEIFTNKFSLNDFSVNPDCPEYCLDLYGICTKVKD